jgi:hypothetical protein
MSDWTTVTRGGKADGFRGWQREAPEAFGRKENPHAARRREEAAAEAARAEREKQEKKTAAATAKAKYEEATRFDSLESYPALGGRLTTPVANRAMDYSRTVATMAQREAEQKAAAEIEAAVIAERAALRHKRHMEQRAAMVLAPPRYIGTRCFDDGPVDYDGPEEDEEDDGYESPPPTMEEPEEADQGEFNAHLMSGQKQRGSGW